MPTARSTSPGSTERSTRSSRTSRSYRRARSGSSEQPANPRSNRAEKIEQLSAKLRGEAPATRKGWRDYLPRLDREGREIEARSRPDILDLDMAFFAGMTAGWAEVIREARGEAIPVIVFSLKSGWSSDKTGWESREADSPNKAFEENR